MEYIVQTHGLTKVIDGKTLVRDVNIHIKRGEIYGFLGPNGAGKTTVMKLLINLWKPTSGSAELFGKTLTPASYEVLKRMGSIIEIPAFYEHLSGAENLELHCEYMGYYSKNCVENALDMLELGRAAKQPVKSYSLGMKQRLGIARAVLTKPELLILDEPTNALDPAGIRQIRDLLRMLCSEYGITIMVSSHLLSEIENLADTVGIIDRGRMLRECPVREITERNTAYLELEAKDVRRASYVLADRMGIRNFKVLHGNKIRIYDPQITSWQVTKVMLEQETEIVSITQKSETLEDFFLKMTEGGQEYGKADQVGMEEKSY